MTVIADAHSAARSLGDHPQDHGWRELYRLFAYGLEQEAPELGDIITTFRKARSDCSFPHLLTLLGIAVKEVDAESFPALIETTTSPTTRLDRLERVICAHGEEIAGILAVRQNSFTAARRFLMVQVLLAARFRGAPGATVNFADLGTGLGILPRQLNSRRLFDRFGPHLRWGDREAAFVPIPLAARYGVDRGPRPDLRWVHACYGASPYYANLYRELQASLALREVRSAAVEYREFDILNGTDLASFVRDRRINAVNLSYVLYEIAPERRPDVIDVLRGALHSPGLVIVTEPVAELAAPGCTITVYDDTRAAAQRLFLVSDGHFHGAVAPLEDYASFAGRHPIRFRPAKRRS